ncbi:preprotein translocase subunit SecG [Mycoplasmopsis felis]|uniref:Protein-export membrane protein SecG n=1 Tax=Mycoplasmopsis felis TaxID=33923 RepID=A0A809SE98_9BACT|nr:preprotein translocase subunit SecG [Mycoplasmopsis felis]MCU9931957.1 preprotein translocase subunit SecG [Mycoplasmopsis felis]MCU9933718.1 preprotein translocase subunit SecG [Mycoplasmopsis felis]MCU9937074.1 preprotein translocase subunit SecG [Mycoplasmopsis felis]MCU9939099.1 preprotein translocase subunit SecG [Mycoplasmopsis felis]MCU9939334.1 preprotein translocase subunit SecG [Mycoplasmopsis felis]
MITLTVFLIIASILLIFVSFLMSPDSNGFSGALVGSNDLDLFKVSKERGFKKFLKYAMVVLGFILLIIVVLIRVFVK